MEQPLAIKTGHATKVNLVFFTDVHLAARAPGRRRNTYGGEILGKLAWTAELTATVKGVGVCGGDLFHVKNPKSDSNPIGYVNQAMGVLQSFPLGRVFGIVGNHDVTGDNMNTLPDQPLGNLMQSGAYHDLGFQSVIFEADNGVRVQVDAFDYLPGDELLERLRARGEENRHEAEQLDFQSIDRSEWPCHFRVAVLHAFNQPGKSGLMFNQDFALGHEDLRDLGYNVVLWGHDHSRKGIIGLTESKGGIYDGNVTHVQLGSLARAALSVDETDRPVSVAICSFSEEGFKIIEKEVPVKPLDLAFHTADLAVEKVEKREDVSQFMQELDRHAITVDSENPVEILETITQDAGIIETIKEVCELH